MAHEYMGRVDRYVGRQKGSLFCLFGPNETIRWAYIRVFDLFIAIRMSIEQKMTLPTLNNESGGLLDTHFQTYNSGSKLIHSQALRAVM